MSVLKPSNHFKALARCQHSPVHLTFNSQTVTWSRCYCDILFKDYKNWGIDRGITEVKVTQLLDGEARFGSQAICLQSQPHTALYICIFSLFGCFIMPYFKRRWKVRTCLAEGIDLFSHYEHWYLSICFCSFKGESLLQASSK